MDDKPQDGNYTFKAGDILPTWCSFAPGSKIERGYVKCRVHNGVAGKWDVMENTRIEGDCYLYNDGKRINKIHIKEKKHITKDEKPKSKNITKRVAIWIFLGLALVIFATAFILNNP